MGRSRDGPPPPHLTQFLSTLATEVMCQENPVVYETHSKTGTSKFTNHHPAPVQHAIKFKIMDVALRGLGGAGGGGVAPALHRRRRPGGRGRGEARGRRAALCRTRWPAGAGRGQGGGGEGGERAVPVILDQFPPPGKLFRDRWRQYRQPAPAPALTNPAVVHPKRPPPPV